MAGCGDMRKGDLFVCKACGLELEVQKTCTCGTGETDCHLPLECCGKEMVKQ